MCACVCVRASERERERDIQRNSDRVIEINGEGKGERKNEVCIEYRCIYIRRDECVYM